MSTQFKSNSFRRQLLLEARAYEMRLTPSEPEARLWRELRCRKLGVQFRRQVVLAGYIVDFFAPAARLIVEVDGAQHALRLNADRRRDQHLATCGLRVLRIPAKLVLGDLQLATAVVHCALW